MNQSKIYLHPGQRKILELNANSATIIAPRGWGKSDGLDAITLLRDVHAMPGSVGALLSPTYGKLLQNTLPAVEKSLKRWGYFRDIHYVIGRKPPKALNFGKPHTEPFDYSYAMTWYNGSTLILVSFDRKMSVNSMSLDYMKGFEAKFLDPDKIREEVNPAMRPSGGAYGNCPWYLGKLFTSDMPNLKSGNWLFEREKLVDKELVKGTRAINEEVKYWKAMKLDNPHSKHYDDKLQALFRKRGFLRSNLHYYKEAFPFDNIEILTPEWFKAQERELPAIIFNTAILNKRLKGPQNRFYSAYNEKIHCYESSNSHYLDGLDYDLRKAQEQTCEKDGDIMLDQQLCIGLDYNSAVNNIVTGQAQKGIAYTLGSRFVKTPKKLQELVQEWCNYYRSRTNRDVVYYYDHTAVSSFATFDESYKDTVIKILEQNNWVVNAVYIGQAFKHEAKQLIIDKAFKGDTTYLFPQFNKSNCEFLLVALENTGVKQGKTGFEKDKSAEKLEDTIENPDESKTHVTDAWDTLYLGMVFYPQSLTGIPVPTFL